VALSAFAYFAFYRLNTFLFSDLQFTHRVHWIYLPGGLRLLLVLLFFDLGVAGIFIGALMMNYCYFFEGDHVFAVVASALVAFSAWLTRFLSLRWFDLGENLTGLSLGIILKMALLLAMLSSLMLQYWFYINGKTNSFWDSLLVMALGKFTGTLIVLSIFSVVLRALREISSRKEKL
jgi:hypothetical protein